MAVKKNLMQIYDELVSNINGIVDKTVCGKCSKCGECCSNFLPISQEELDIIQRYVIKNNIKPQTEVLVMENRLACPYWNHKCLIYEVRPLICKEFYCNKKIDSEMFEKFKGKELIPVNMWAVAREIEKQRKEINENGKRRNH